MNRRLISLWSLACALWLCVAGHVAALNLGNAFHVPDSADALELDLDNEPGGARVVAILARVVPAFPGSSAKGFLSLKRIVVSSGAESSSV